MPKTTLIFATANDASPLIHLNTYRATVAGYLRSLRSFVHMHDKRPGLIAARFIASFSPDTVDQWELTVESTPMFYLGGALTLAENDPSVIVWDSEAWREVTEWDEPEAPAPVQVGFSLSRAGELIPAKTEPAPDFALAAVRDALVVGRICGSCGGYRHGKHSEINHASWCTRPGGPNVAPRGLYSVEA